MSTRLDQLNEFLKESPEDPFLKYAIAAEYLKQNNEQEALDRFEKLINSHPDYVGTYYHLGKLYEKLDKQELAIKTYKQGIDIARKSRNFHALGELQGALSFLDEDEDDDF
ncbi:MULTISPECIES: tetratricopeptide repeat protein [Sphingobacterium]|uniref:Tetratricopeptide repeat protein n=1 Tax=Sphingobacterium athyrii TaxID=2152717 RepID=A0A363NM42_9SPHI|nr:MULTISPECIES: tetratricopeptide repeat protein [Sphingobacterium]PUV21711.1 tetratricopeptide repeat protein [Sphingobacterium athyrii]QIH35735.1 tetratricopeptide repeat protein [Sphingobacterium sp. DR205]